MHAKCYLHLNFVFVFSNSVKTRENYSVLFKVRPIVGVYDKISLICCQQTTPGQLTQYSVILNETRIP